MTRADEALTVCVIGAGPRGLPVPERIRADAGGVVRPVEVHLADPYPPGAGAARRTDRPAELLSAAEALIDRALHRYEELRAHENDGGTL